MTYQTTQIREEITIKFAGDSGDGMQLTGNLFTENTALLGNDLATFPDFPAEIRAPQGTLAGVSGFQLCFGSKKIVTPGDEYDVLVAMNAAALKVNLERLKKSGTIILNENGFDTKNLRLAKYEQNPIEDHSLDSFEIFKISISKLTREALKESPLSTREKDKCKNMFVLGFLFWRYNRQMNSTIAFLSEKFKRNPDILEANLKTLKTGYYFGDTTETFATNYRVYSAPMPKGNYRNIMGNQALILGLIAAAQKANISLFYGSYPITPASDILHGLARYKHFGIKTFQAEDEISAICTVIGAAYGGNLAVTGTSGPGLALKSEGIGLAITLELPIVICNIQRGGPSTGLPTKTEQSDLLQSLYGRNGESPLPVIAAKSPSDCFESVFTACRIALEHMTPVIFLSDGYIANGASPWRFPESKDIKPIQVQFEKAKENGKAFLPYIRNSAHIRPWALPGTKGLTHRIGSLEKENETGNVSYDPINHELMTQLREAKIEKIADYIPEQNIQAGAKSGDLLLLGWGSTYGVIQSVVETLYAKKYQVGQIHLRHICPFPKNLGSLLKNFKKILIPEINRGQLAKIIRDKFLISVISFGKVQGVPITKSELKDFSLKVLHNK